ANVSHELKTPLTVLKGYVETLQDMLPPEPVVWQQALGQMEQQNERMESLINNLLWLANLEGTDSRLDQTAVPLVPLLEKIQRELTVMAEEKHQQLVLDTTGMPSSLVGHAIELESAFTNLIV